MRSLSVLYAIVVQHGCECGACPPIEFVDANNLFNGDASDYEDYESTRNYYTELSNDYEDLDCIL